MYRPILVQEDIAQEPESENNNQKWFWKNSSLALDTH